MTETFSYKDFTTASKLNEIQNKIISDFQHGPGGFLYNSTPVVTLSASVGDNGWGGVAAGTTHTVVFGGGLNNDSFFPFNTNYNNMPGPLTIADNDSNDITGNFHSTARIYEPAHANWEIHVTVEALVDGPSNTDEITVTIQNIFRDLV